MEKLKYPIVLQHGFGGSNKVLGYGYFHYIDKRLVEWGNETYYTKVSSKLLLVDAGKVFARQLDDILKRTGASKVNIIAHSWGGLVARETISTLGYGDRIASLTTISTPHRGLKICQKDSVLKLILFKYAMAVKLLFLTGEVSSSMKETLEEFSPLGMLEFNKKNPNDSRVFYSSLAGRAHMLKRNHRVRPMPILWDFFLTSMMYEDNPTDGVVSVRSSIWGEFQGLFHADHLDMAGTILSKHRDIDYDLITQKIYVPLKKRGF